MSQPLEEAETYNALYVEFLYLLREYGVPASTRDLLELNEGLERGIVKVILIITVKLQLLSSHLNSNQ